MFEREREKRESARARERGAERQRGRDRDRQRQADRQSRGCGGGHRETQRHRGERGERGGERGTHRGSLAVVEGPHPHRDLDLGRHRGVGWAPADRLRLGARPELLATAAPRAAPPAGRTRAVLRRAPAGVQATSQAAGLQLRARQISAIAERGGTCVCAWGAGARAVLVNPTQAPTARGAGARRSAAGRGERCAVCASILSCAVSRLCTKQSPPPPSTPPSTLLPPYSPAACVAQLAGMSRRSYAQHWDGQNAHRFPRNQPFLSRASPRQLRGGDVMPAKRAPTLASFPAASATNARGLRQFCVKLEKSEQFVFFCFEIIFPSTLSEGA